ncbi:MAG: glycosyltransferase family 2 protein, partial [Candidatus Cloacimonetes bacterium]|nr:glycosyltransferase family 2 protein [Candidatus Cloacimonadota bacterium]
MKKNDKITDPESFGENPLVKFLYEKNWSEKLSLYERFFKSVEYINPKDTPAVSIIIIAWKSNPILWNELVMLNQQIDSLYAHSELQCENRNVEIVFVNNGSDDPYMHEIKSLVNVYVELNTNTGAYLARNIGSVFAQAPLLLFCEDDGIPDENFIAS